jgi:antitoxin component of RelBE/YafQ-DinJ toxin-antitoxin module
MTEKKDTVNVNVRVPPELRKQAKKIARDKDLTLSQIIRQFLRQWVAESDKDSQ